jgi:hypothetical protein
MTCALEVQHNIVYHSSHENNTSSFSEEDEESSSDKDNAHWSDSDQSSVYNYNDL